jgi:hypothetical protein
MNNLQQHMKHLNEKMIFKTKILLWCDCHWLSFRLCSKTRHAGMLQCSGKASSSEKYPYTWLARACWTP